MVLLVPLRRSTHGGDVDEKLRTTVGARPRPGEQIDDGHQAAIGDWLLECRVAGGARRARRAVRRAEPSDRLRDLDEGRLATTRRLLRSGADGALDPEFAPPPVGLQAPSRGTPDSGRMGRAPRTSGRPRAVRDPGGPSAGQEGSSP